MSLKMRGHIEPIILPKPRMRNKESTRILQEASKINKKIVIQIEAVDRNGFYLYDVISSIKTSDSLGMYINNQKVHDDEIRNIQFYK